MAYKQKNNPFNSSGSPIKQLGPTMVDNAGAYHKIKKGIPRALNTIGSMLPIGGVSTIAPKAVKKLAGSFANTAKQYAKKGFGKAKPKGSFTKDPYTRHRTRLMKEGMSKTEVFKRFPTKDMMTPQQLKNIARAAGKSMPSGGNFRPIVTGNKVYDKKSINKAFKSRFGKPKK